MRKQIALSKISIPLNWVRFNIQNQSSGKNPSCKSYVQDIKCSGKGVSHFRSEMRIDLTLSIVLICSFRSVQLYFQFICLFEYWDSASWWYCHSHVTRHLPEQPAKHELQSIPGTVLNCAEMLIKPKPSYFCKVWWLQGLSVEGERPGFKSLCNDYICFIKVLGSWGKNWVWDNCATSVGRSWTKYLDTGRALVWLKHLHHSQMRTQLLLEMSKEPASHSLGV